MIAFSMNSVATLLLLSSFFFRVLSTQAWIRVSVSVSVPRYRGTFPSILSTTTRQRRKSTQLSQQRRLIPSFSNPNTKVAIVSRTVPITNIWNITVWEWETPAPLVEDYWSAHEEDLHHQHYNNQRKQQSTKITSKTDLLDPFGLITWPGAVVAVQELLQEQHLIQNATVLVLGSGVGLEVQGAARLGAARVYALDVHPTTLQLLQYGIPSHLSHVVTPIVFDLCHPQIPLPFLETVDVMIVADVLYSPELAQHVARRCREAYDQGAQVLITDSQRLVHNFVEMIPPCQNNTGNNNNTKAVSPAIVWQERRLNDFTGSGILVEQDQTYNVAARTIWMKHPDIMKEITMDNTL